MNPTVCNRKLERFWSDWDIIAEERRTLTQKRRVDWEAVDQTLIKHNLMLKNRPCHDLHALHDCASTL